MIAQLLTSAPATAVGQQVQRVPAETLHPSWTPAWAFWSFAILVVAGAIVTITRRNLIGAVMSLVATFFGLAGIYALLSAHFLAAIQVLVYAGAIMVLFIFVVMVLNREEEEPWALRNRFGKAVGIGALVYLLVRLGEVILGATPAPMVRSGPPPEEFGTVSGIADYFFTRFLFPFEAVSILLIIAVIGAVVLARTIARPTSVYELPPDVQPHGPEHTIKVGEEPAQPAAGHGGH